MRFSNEIKAGVVIIMGVLIGAFFFFKTVDLRQETYQLKTCFGHAGNIKSDALVKLAGIEVGRVVDINFEYGPETRVLCVMELDSAARVRSDAIAYIGTDGFVGDAFIGITGGSSADFLAPGDPVPSEDPVELRKIMKKAEDIATNLDIILLDVKALMGDNRQHIDNIVLNLEDTTRNFKEFSEDVKKHPWKLMFRGRD